MRNVATVVASVEGTQATGIIKTSNDYRHRVGSAFAVALASHPGHMNGPAGLNQGVSARRFN